MKHEIKLFFDFEFTSLSPDAQPISLGIVSSSNLSKRRHPIGVVGWDRLSAMNIARERGLQDIGNKDCVLLYKPENFCSWMFSEIIIPEQVGKIDGYELSIEMQKAIEIARREQVVNESIQSKSFYSEFSDFDLNRCDDWVKENVVGKLMTNSVANKLGISFENAKDAAKTSTNWSREYCILKSTERGIAFVGNTWRIKEELKKWLEQFSDYNIQFVCDCGTWDWYWMLQLLAEWEVKVFKQKTKELHEILGSESMAFGLPKLPDNISPIPEDLNDLIAHKKGISAREAFDLNREELVGSWDSLEELENTGNVYNVDQFPKHNSMFDAKVIKAIYEKLK